jgi:hypothetical protein
MGKSGAMSVYNSADKSGGRLTLEETMLKRLVAVPAVVALLLFPQLALAQNLITLPYDTPLARILYEVYFTEIRDNLRSMPDATPEAVASALTDLDDALLLTGALSTQLSTFPLGSSAGGFAWTFDPTVGTFTRTSPSFGPTFAERALTVGRHKLNVGINYQRSTYDDFEGLSLRNGGVKFYTDFGEGDIAEDSLSLDVSTNTVGFFANYGVTNRLDVGIAVPITKVDLKASLRFVFRDAQGEQSSDFVQTTTGGGRRTGLGDIVVRAKYNLLERAGGGLGVGLDLRLPTGDEDNLLGIPGTQTKIYGIFSAAVGRVSPHVNIGYTVSNGNDAVTDPTTVFLEPPDEFNYAAGIDIALNPRVTFAADLVGRTLRDIARLEVSEVGFGPAFQEFTRKPERENLQLPLTALGIKFNAWGNLLISGNVLFPLTKNGLRDHLTPVLGFDYSF